MQPNTSCRVQKLGHATTGNPHVAFRAEVIDVV